MQRLSPAGSHPGPNPHAARRRGPATILCVDDEQPALVLRKAVLERAGYRVHTASTAVSALELAKTRRIDVALVDLDMPDMNGYSVAALLRCTQPRARIVIFSGHDCRAVQKLMMRELDGCIIKGTPVPRFLEQVALHVAARARRAPRACASR